MDLAMSPPKDSLFVKYFQIFLVVSAYWIISISTVFVNKTLLSHVDLDAPMFVAFFQIVITILICYAAKFTSYLAPNLFKFPETNCFKWSTFKDVLPLALFFTAMIASNNLCLKYVAVTFYYIGRSLTTIFNVIFTFIILREKTSSKCIGFCILIIFGFYLGVDQENIAGSLSISGTFFGVFSSLSLSLYSIFTKRVLPTVNQEVWLLNLYVNLYSSVMFVPLIIINGELAKLINYSRIFDLVFWSMMLVGGGCGFLIGFFTALQIKYTSALTHNISGTAKACAQTVLAAYWYSDVKSCLWWLSNGIVLFGSAGYARVKQVDMEKRHRESVIYQKL